MSRFAKALGKLELNIEGVELSLKPKQGDIYNFRKIYYDRKYKNDQFALMKVMGDFFVQLIKREQPPVSDEEEQDLELFVEEYVERIMEKAMIGWRMIDEDTMQKAKEKLVDDEKNSLSAN